MTEEKIVEIHNNVKPLNFERKFSLEDNLHKSILATIYQFSGQTSLVAVLGVLELVKQDLIINAKNSN